MKKTLYFYLSFLLAIVCTSLQAGIPMLNIEKINSGTRILDKNLVVGSIIGNSHVNNMGSYEYDIPLEIPPGSKQVQPRISIHYSNQTGRGTLGHGWSIAGLSQITRCGKTTYYDQIKKEIQLNHTDELALDGQRLLLLSGTHMTTGAVYRFEIEDYSRVQITSSDPTAGPLTLALKSSDGSVTSYGLDKTCLKTNTGIAYRWMASKTTDVYGNYILYQYNNTASAGTTGEPYLEKIVYTGNATTGLAPFNTILFNYAQDPHTKQYLGGHPISQDLILTGIHIQHKQTTLRSYSFAYFKYNTSLFSLHLKEIKMSVGGSFVNSTLVHWGEETQTYQINNLLTTPLAFKQIVIGDFNGDGKSDYLKYNHTHHQLYISTGDNFILKFTNSTWGARQIMAFDVDKDGKDEIIRLTEINGATQSSVYGLRPDETYFEPDNQMAYPPAFPPAVFNNYPPSNFQLMAGDIDGDGEPDISLSYNQHCCSGLFQKPNISGTGTTNIFGKLNNALTNHNFQSDAQYYTTDFNGNGVYEILALNHFNNSNNYAVFEYNNTYDRIDKLFHNNFPLPIHTAHEKRIYPGDYNGDGKTDLLVYNEHDRYWKIYYSKGNSFDVRIIDPLAYPSPSAELPLAGNHNAVFTQEYQAGIPDPTAFESACYGSNNISFGDFNGDGMTDLAYLKIEEDDPNDLYAFFIEMYYATGSGFKYSGHKIYLATLDDACENIPQMHTGDYNGDSKTDLMVSYYSDGNIHIIQFNPNTTAPFVRKIVNGFNQSTEIAYQTIANNLIGQSVYSKTNTAYTHPISVIQSPFHVVSSVTTPDGIGGTVQTKYFYKDLLCHTLGKGMLGFAQVRKQYPNGTIELTMTKWESTHFYFPSRITHLKYLNGDISKDNLGFYIFRHTSLVNTLPQQQLFKIQLKQEDKQEDFVLSTTTRSSFEYYSNNYLKKSIIESIDEISGNVINTQFYEIKNYAAASTKPILLPASIEEKNNHASDKDDAGNQQSHIRTKDIIYNAQGDAVTIIEDAKNSKLSKSTTYLYHANGTLMQKKITAQGKSRTEEYSYDPLSINIASIKDLELSPTLSKNIYYDATNGLPIQETDLLNHLLSNKLYDGLNRLIKEENQFGVATNYEYAWSDLPNYLYVIRTYGINMPTVKTYYDLLGRPVYRIEEGLKGNKYAATKYNIYGQIEQEEEPEYTSAAKSFNRYEYDAYGRVVTITDACGRSIRKIYTSDRKEITTDAAGRTTTITKDALGNIVESIGIDQMTVQTIYNSQLKPKRVEAAGSITNYKYDIHGNKISAYNSNTGTATSLYNSFDLLIEHTDEKKNVFFYEYDAANRLNHKYIFHRAQNNADNNGGIGDPHNEHIHIHYYDNPTHHEFGLISSIESNRGYKKEMTYKATRLTESITETIQGKSFQTLYTYDGYGRQKTITYPNGYQLDKNYNALGQFYQLVETKTGATLYTLFADDGKGREIEFGWGQPFNTSGGSDPWGGSTCGLISSNTYSACMDHISIQTQALGGSGNMAQYKKLIHLEYQVDPNTGNISGREDVMKHLKESFEYDAFDRLSLSRNDHTNYVTNYEYANNGNLEFKSDLGAYHYDPNNQPHAVKMITPVCNFQPICVGKQFVQYNGFNRPFQIMLDQNQLYFEYDESGSRTHWTLYEYPQIIDQIEEDAYAHTPNPTVVGHVDWGNATVLSGNGNMLQEKIYSGDYEEKIDYATGKITQTVYIRGPFGITGVHVSDPFAQTSNTYFIQKDHIGSFIALIDVCGNIAEEYSFDAWGKRRNPYTWSSSHLLFKPAQVDPISGVWQEGVHEDDQVWQGGEPAALDCTPLFNWIIDRGYTGQEHHDMFGLINLNARLYDPLIGRMLGPDPYINNTLHAGDFNSYTYALNNPMKYNDPSGESPFLFAAMIAVGIHTASYTLQVGFQSNWTFRNWNWDDFGLGVFQSFAQGMMTAGIGQAFNNMSKAPALIKELGRAAAHGGMNAFISAGSGEFSFANFITGFGSSLAGSAMQEATELESIFTKTATMIGFSSLSGGVLETLQGGNFIDGAATGLIIGTLNHALHPLIDLAQMKEIENMASKPGNYLVYEATYTKEGYRTKGHLVLYSAEGEELIRIPAASGSNNVKAPTIPAGEWNTEKMVVPNDKRFERDGVRFAIKLGPDREDPARNRQTSGMYIHPMQNSGTLGCIGLGSGKTLLNKFYNFYKNYYQKYGGMKLNIILTK